VTITLPLAPGQDARETRDRLEILTALINAPSFDPVLRPDVINVPVDHPTFGWVCVIPGCARAKESLRDMCGGHIKLLRARPAGMDRAEFIRTAEPLQLDLPFRHGRCTFCPGRPAVSAKPMLVCTRHRVSWRWAERTGQPPEQWLAAQKSFPSYGNCEVVACADVAASPLGLCPGHQAAYHRAGRPGGACLPEKWKHTYDHAGRKTPVHYQDRDAFIRWCSTTGSLYWPGQINLLGLSPLVKAEIRWGLFAHGQQKNHSSWHLAWVHSLVNESRGLNCLADIDPGTCRRHARQMAQEIRAHLRPLYVTPAASKEAGFIDGQHFGVKPPGRRGYYDLTGVSQRWLRDLLWDAMAARMRSPHAARSASPYDNTRRAALELSAFLEADAPAGGHDPSQLREEHMLRFVADQRARAREGQQSLGVRRFRGEPTKVTAITRRFTFNYGRSLLRPLLESDGPETLRLDRAFITALPPGGFSRGRTRSPFSDDVARALADEANLQRLAEAFDRNDRGIRDIWETIIVTGRRAGEVLNLRFECLGRYNGLPMLWHDQTKVGNYDEAVRIPERVHSRLEDRQRKTLRWFEGRTGRLPSPDERSRMALFPSGMCNPVGERAISINFFHQQFRQWVAELDLGGCVPHQARHTLATRLLAAGAGLHHIRRYLGHVSIVMTEHYAKVAMSEVEDILQHVWVAGPGAPRPGELLSNGLTGMSRQEAEAMAVDLNRRSTPTEGGFCTFQPVVDGRACPWNLNCQGCASFVMSGADLLYWRRKREQWMSIAERAPDDATADYLHKVFQPTAAAIAGLEKALSALGLLEDALALDMRRPQDYFQRLWSLSFRATDLANRGKDDFTAEEQPA
jgi:integrase